jgi:KRAB domain-containing zinc finger protein
VEKDETLEAMQVNDVNHLKESHMVSTISKNLKPIQELLSQKPNNLIEADQELDSQKCKICGKMLYDKYSLRKHIKVVHEKLKPFECLHCKKGFGTKQNLTYHLYSVHKLMQSLQELLSQKTNNLMEADQELDSPKCKICGKMLSDKSKLSKHIKVVHKQLKPFECLHCKKGFGTKQNLTFHLFSVYKLMKPSQGLLSQKPNNLMEADQELDSQKCKICGKMLSNKSNLRKHIKVVHEKLKPFECLHCEIGFSAKQNLTYHLYSVHKLMKPLSKLLPKTPNNPTNERVFCKKILTTEQSLSKHIKGGS